MPEKPLKRTTPKARDADAPGIRSSLEDSQIPQRILEENGYCLVAKYTHKQVAIGSILDGFLSNDTVIPGPVVVIGVGTWPEFCAQHLKYYGHLPSTSTLFPSLEF